MAGFGDLPRNDEPAADRDPAADWQRIVFDHDNYRRLRYLAQKTFPRDENMRTQCFNRVLEEISADGWSLLVQKYRGRGSRWGFLRTVFKRRLVDCLRRLTGRRRCPKWISANGWLWEKVWEMLCLKREQPEHVVQVLAAGPAARDPEGVRRVIAAIRAGDPDCGRRDRTQALELDDFGQGDRQGSLAAPGPEEDPEELEAVLWLIRRLVAPAEASADGVPAVERWPYVREFHSRLEQLRRRLHLDDRQRLVLKLVYMEGLSVSGAARLLKETRHRTDTARKKALEHIRKGFEEVGFNDEYIKELVR